MTTVSAIKGSGAPLVKPTATDAGKAKMDYDAFLRLFIASMKNQDPSKPNDPTQTLAQLASFSNVEQSIKLNEKLETLVSSSTSTLAASMVGKMVSSLDGSQSGLVKSVEYSGDGLVAIFANGKRFDLSGGYRIAAA